MERPRIVVIERNHYPHEVDYEEEIAGYERAGYRVVLRRLPGNPEMDYVVMEEVD